MSFFKRLFGRRRPSSTPSPPPPVERDTPDAADPAQPPRADSEAELLESMRRIGRVGGAEPAEALRRLRRLDGSAAQTPLLRALVTGLRAADRQAAGNTGLEPLRLACASLLDARGERAQALALAEHTSSVGGMILAADLHASAGQLPRAVSLIERALAHDIDAPGASERHQRWTAQLGRQPRRRATDDGATVVAAKSEQTSFRVLRQVARGGAGTVYQAEDVLLGRRLAFKLYHCPDRDRAQIEREARRAVELRGPGVLRIFDASPEQGWIATEWVARGSLHDALVQGRSAELLPLARWLPKLLAAVARVHRAKLVHADLKPANVLLRSADEPLLADFGICVPVGTASFAGTPGYLAPERIAGEPAHPRDDVYAIGRIIEDVLRAQRPAASDAAPLADGDPAVQRWAALAQCCLAAGARRPADAAALLRSLE